MSKVINAYAKMKNKNGKDTVILFHVGNGYNAYLDDSIVVSEITGIEREIDYQSQYFVIYKTVVPEDMCEEVVNKILDAGHAICVSEVIGNDGTYVLTN